MNKIEWIIALLLAKNEQKINGITRFEKLLFYILKERGELKEKNVFQFEPYDYGPHTDELRDILYALRDKNIIKIETQNTDNFLEIDDMEIDEDELKPINYDKQEVYSLTELGRRIGNKISLKFENFKALNDFKSKFNGIPLNRLIQIIYTKYPEMTKKSKIVSEIFG